MKDAPRVAWRTPTQTISFAELESRVRRCASWMKKQGVMPGDQIAVRGVPALDVFTLLLASIWQKVVLFPLPDRLPDSVHQLMMQQVPLQFVWDQLFFEEEDEAQGHWEWNEEALAVGIFTSGSTGLPKAIMHSWKSLKSSAEATNIFYGVEAGDSWLLSLDIAHVGGLQIAVRCYLAGATVWHFAEPKAIAAVLREQSPQFLSLVPTQLYRLMQDANARHQMRACKAIILGGAATSFELFDEALEADLPVSVSYGSSETAAQCTALPPRIRPRHTGDVGRLLAGWEYQSSGETLRLRGPALCKGYYQQKEFHVLQDAEGWMTLPDRILCEAGRLTVLGRADGIFQVAGENVAPLDIIQPLEPLRRHADFLALPWQDKEYGTVPVLIVRSAQKPDVPPLVELLQKNLTGVQRPRRIYWHESDEIGKPSRSAYQKALESGELALIWRQDLGRI